MSSGPSSTAITAASTHFTTAGFLLQARFFGGGGGGGDQGGQLRPGQLSVLRKLPVFETHPSLPFERPGAAAAGAVAVAVAAAAAGEESPGGEESSSGGGGGSRFMSLAAALAAGCALPPPGAPPPLLGTRFLKADSDSEEAALAGALGAPRTLLSAFLRTHVAPNADALDRDAVDGALAAALRGGRGLAGSDPDLHAALVELPLVPARAPGRPRRAPGQLFDGGSGDLAVGCWLPIIYVGRVGTCPCSQRTESEPALLPDAYCPY